MDERAANQPSAAKPGPFEDLAARYPGSITFTADGQGDSKATFHPALARVAAGITHRLDQAEARLAAAHPRAARDGQLAAMLDDIRDEAASLGDPESSLYAE